MITIEKAILNAMRCVCCNSSPHDWIPDHDLKGFVCHDCNHHLNSAVYHLYRSAGIAGCISAEDRNAKPKH